MDENMATSSEQDYSDFENKFLTNSSFWRAPFASLRETMLYRVFEDFAKQFPDHPSELNTVIYLTEPLAVTPPLPSIWLWCSHFEHFSLDDLRDLVSFMGAVRLSLGGPHSVAAVELLDSFGQELVLSFSFPKPEVSGLIRVLGMPSGT